MTEEKFKTQQSLNSVSVQDLNVSIQEGFVHENEVKEIITFMNKNLDDCLSQAEREKAKSKELEQKVVDNTIELNHFRAQIADLEKERDHFKDMSEKYFRELKTKEKELTNHVLTKMETVKATEDDFPHINTIIQKLSEQEDKDFLTEFVNNHKTLKSNYKILSADLEDIVKENKELQSRIEVFEEEKFGMRTCQNCHEKFSPLQNEDGSCQYHPGKLKFYSCRGCGRDEYYTCCNKCKQCNRGCKGTRHIGPSEV